jgi:hypothetical protein
MSSLTSCPSGSFDPGTISELLVMINSLPKPLDADCFLKNLKRPLYVNASSSTMSVQPAVNEANPRIFIFNKNLIITIVPTGEGSLVMEFSELKNDVRSIKGEIVLPVKSNVSGSAPFTRISSGSQTTCRGCHTSEQAEYMIGDVQVYSSKALKPTASKDVSISRLQDENYLCNFRKDTSKRCRIYNALFSGQVIPKVFPADMPTLLDAF